MTYAKLRATALTLLLSGAWLGTTGCFSERSFPMRGEDYVRLADDDAAGDLPPRVWLRGAHQNLGPLLPPNRPSALLTEDLVDAQGRPVDVLAHFKFKRETLETIGANCEGLLNTAQLAGVDFTKEHVATNWSGYKDVWIPINPRLSLHGLFGYADEGGKPRDADCIVLLPGFFGHNDILRTHDLADALRQAGLHTLALEVRGHGKTEMKYPDIFYNYGTLETGDLMVVSEWLQSQPHVRRTGIVGFCWGANEALLAAWYDGRSEAHASIADRLAPRIRPVSPQRHFEAGVMAFSPVLRFEEIVDRTDRQRNPLGHPVLAALQETIRSRVVLKAHNKHPAFDPRACIGSLRKLIDYEYARSELDYPGSVRDGLQFLRFLPYKGLPDGDKLDSARIPVLIVHAANDPLSCAQDVADLIAKTPNPNVAAVVIAGGGHVGFAAYARSYYFSLILNFFTRHHGPGSMALQ